MFCCQCTPPRGQALNSPLTAAKQRCKLKPNKVFFKRRKRKKKRTTQTLGPDCSIPVIKMWDFLCFWWKLL